MQRTHALSQTELPVHYTLNALPSLCGSCLVLQIKEHLKMVSVGVAKELVDNGALVPAGEAVTAKNRQRGLANCTVLIDKQRHTMPPSTHTHSLSLSLSCTWTYSPVDDLVVLPGPCLEAVPASRWNVTDNVDLHMFTAN